MDRPISLDEALEARAVAVATYCARALGNVGAWAGYQPSEGLVGRVEHPAELGGSLTVTFHRPSHPEAQLVFGFVSMVDVTEEHRSAPVVTHAGVTERERYVIKLPAGVTQTKTIRHEFTRTVSEAEAAKAAWEVAAKASLGVSVAGVTGAIEASAKYGEELSRQVTRTGTETNVEEETITVTGPIDLTYEAYRSLDRETRTVRVRCDFDAKIYFITPGGASNVWEWTTYRSQFVPLARGLLGADVYGYDEFRATPPTDEELAAFARASDKLVEFEIAYDNVVTKHLEAV